MFRDQNFNVVSAIYIAFTPIFSVAFGVLGIPMPSYLFASFIATFLVIFYLSERFKLFPPRLNIISLAFLLFLFLSITSFVVHRNNSAPLEKLQNLAYVVFFPILLVAVFLSPPKSIGVDYLKTGNRIYYVFFVISTALLVFAFAFFRTAETEGRYVIPGINNPIWLSRHLAAGLLVYVTYNLATFSKLKPIQVFISLIIFFALILSGSKAPVVALLVTLLFFVIKTKLLTPRKFLNYFGIFFLFAFLLFSYSSSYVFETNYYSVFHRFDALAFVIEQPFSLMGKGLSSFGRLYVDEDIDIYPHNLLAELYFEFGIPGLFIFAAILFAVIATYHKSVAGVLALYYFINAMSSGDIPGNAPLFLSLYVAFNVNESQKRASKAINVKAIPSKA